jgi:lipid-A-disaccharide synthase
MKKLNNEKSDLIIITNGPGELASWVKPSVNLLKNSKFPLRVSIFLPPCPFSSGQEERIARDISGVDIVLNPVEFIKFLIFGKTVDFKSLKKGIVLFLGGEPLHAFLVAKRLGFPVIAYSERAFYLNKYFIYSLVPDEHLKKKLIKSGVKSETIKVTGNLTLASIEVTLTGDEARNLWGLSKNILTVGLMPGSRPFLLRHAVAYMMKVAEEVYKDIETQFLLPLSPHITIDMLRDSLLHTEDLMLEGSSGELDKDEQGLFIKTINNVKIRVVENNQYNVMNCCDLILAIPGTINAEAASLGIPMVVCYTYNKPEIIPVGGLPAILGKIPLTGPFLKFIVWKIFQRLKFFAIPNIKAGEFIVPEIRVHYKADEISSVMVELLRDSEKRKEMSEKLKKLFMREGASQRLSNVVLEVLGNFSDKGE